MPGGDRTGPLGRGSMTGRRLGRCAGNGRNRFEPGLGGWGPGRGFFGSGRVTGAGRGYGRGYGYNYGANIPDVESAGVLHPDISQTSGPELSEINRQLTEMRDQLAKLLKQTVTSGAANDEKK